jgi:hypothetical protein
LGQSDERFTQPSLARDRQLIRNADLELLAVEQAMDRAAADVPIRLAAWRSAVPNWSAALLRDEPRSLFNAATLKNALRLGLQGSSKLESP